MYLFLLFQLCAVLSNVGLSLDVFIKFSMKFSFFCDASPFAVGGCTFVHRQYA
jgi:hypothetical protein